LYSSKYSYENASFPVLDHPQILTLKISTHPKPSTHYILPSDILMIFGSNLRSLAAAKFIK